MFGPRQNVFRRAGLFHLTVAQHQDTIRHLRDHREIMRYVDRRRAAFPHDFFEREQDFDLGGHIECRGGLIQHYQRWIGDEGHRCHQSLQLAAGNLMRVAPADVIRVGQGQFAE